MLAFDLDPGEPATAVECAQVALRLRDLFASFELECFPKHSGSKGIQVYVPLNTAVTYEQTKPYARAVAQALEQSEPEARRLEAGPQAAQGQGARRLEPERLLEDDRRRLLAALPPAPVGVDAADLGRGRDARRRRRPGLGAFEAPEALERIAEHGDLFAPVLELKQKLPKAVGSADDRPRRAEAAARPAVWSAGDFDAIAKRIWAVGDDLVARVGIGEADRVLDVACGTRQRDDPGGRSPARSSPGSTSPRSCSRTGAAMPPSRGRDRVGRGRRAGACRSTTQSFDVVVSTFGCMFAPDHGAAAAEIARVLRPGGRIGIAAWRPAGNIGGFFLTIAALRAAAAGGIPAAAALGRPRPRQRAVRRHRRRAAVRGGAAHFQLRLDRRDGRGVRDQIRADRDAACGARAGGPLGRVPATPWSTTSRRSTTAARRRRRVRRPST